MRHVDTLSTIYRHIFHTKLPTKSLFVEKKKKNGQKLVLYYPENSKLPTKSLSEEEKKNGQNRYYIIQKIIERSISASHVQCLLQKRTSHQARFNAIQHKGDILPIQTCGDFYVPFVYRYCHEQSTCHIVPWLFRQSSIIWTIDNSTNFTRKKKN